MAAILSIAGSAIAADKTLSDRITRDTIFSSEGIELTSKDCLTTPGTFQPPVAITIVAKTDSHDLRMAYAADQVIFNWGDNPHELRVDGGPANGLHKAEAGEIPTGIEWLMSPWMPPQSLLPRSRHTTSLWIYPKRDCHRVNARN